MLARRVDVGLLRVLGNVLQGNASLLGLGRPAMARVHVPDCTRDPGSIGHISVEIPIISPAHGSAVFIDDERPMSLRSVVGTAASAS